jgi:integrase
MIVSLLAYGGLRPQELVRLPWGRVGTASLIVHSPKTWRHNPKPRTVKLLAPLAQDLREWRLASARPAEHAAVIPGARAQACSDGRLRAVAGQGLEADTGLGGHRLPPGPTTCAIRSLRCCCTTGAR